MPSSPEPPTSELLRQWCELTLTLHERLKLPSIGSPLPGRAEQLVAVLYDGTLARTGQKDWDVESPSGRIQVKALWDLGKRTRRRLGTIGTDLHLFVAVVFDAEGRVAEVWQVEGETLDALRGDAARSVVRLPWVRSNGSRLERDRVNPAAEELGLVTV